MSKLFEPTIKDIARICGVGVSTVSRAINNHPDINPDTKKKILDTIKEYGYIPNSSARNLKKTDAKAIAVLAKGIANPFFMEMIRVIEEECKRKHYAMELVHVEADLDEVEVALKVVKEKRLRGIIFLGGRFSHSDEKLSKLQVPFVFSTAASVPEKINGTPFSNVGVNDRLESEKMVDYLISQGHKHIAILVAKTDDNSISQLRLDGYKDALNKHDIKVRDDLIIEAGLDNNSFSLSNGYLATQKLIEAKTDFTALFAVSDTLAIGAGKALNEAGFRIPADISLAGFDGIEIGQYITPALTTVKQPVEDIAKASIKLLFDIIAEKKTHQNLIYDASLLIRESTQRLHT